QNYPNPFNPTTTISFSISKMQDVKLSVFNSSGQLVKELVNDKLSNGSHTILFNAENLNSGIYFYTLETDNKILSNKMLLIK
ncbi:MAG: T9SS type A sorting domain-containing protein, partial [Candidatus Delongbacteria bacterium]|nr:T9SS type A sorting domain-containing protein [Candidatus Delongbacteria bacterium]